MPTFSTNSHRPRKKSRVSSFRPRIPQVAIHSPLSTLHIIAALLFTAFPKTRYDAVREHSPFAVATAEAPPVAPQASFASNWFVSGIGRLGDEDFVTIKSRDLSTEFSLFGREADSATGVAVASVNWTDEVGKSTVILRKGTETAKLEFNEAEVHATPAGNPQAKPGAPAPNAMNPPRTPPNMNGAPRPPNVPANPAMSGAPPVHRRAQVIQPPQ